MGTERVGDGGVEGCGWMVLSGAESGSAWSSPPGLLAFGCQQVNKERLINLKGENRVLNNH